MSITEKPPLPLTILMAEDDPDDQMLAREAFAECRLRNALHTVDDGVELMDYLHQRGAYADKEKHPRPGIILLDLNMPKLDGRGALRQIRADVRLRSIPVVVMTTSKAREDVINLYEMGVNSFITKPISFERMVEVLKQIGKYWFEIVDLPADISAG